MLLEHIVNTEAIESTEIIENVIQTNNGLDTGDVITGIVIPIIAAILAYILAERAGRRKEANRLVIELNWIKKEIENNKLVLEDYLSKIEIRDNLEKRLRYPFPSFDEFLKNVIEKIENIYLEHKVFDEFLLFGQYGKTVENMMFQYESLEKDIYDLEDVYAEFSELPETIQKQIEDKKIERAELRRKIEDSMDPNNSIFSKLHNLNYYIEHMKIGDSIPMIDEDNEATRCIRYIRKVIKEYSEIKTPSSEDAKNVLKKLLVYNSQIDVFKSISELEDVEKEIRDISMSHCDSEEIAMIKMYESFVLLRELVGEIENYRFKVNTSKWDKFQDDFVLINNSKVYFEICNLYELIASENMCENNTQTVIDKSIEVIEVLIKLEKKLKRVCYI